jgi:hypothetical protein
VTLVTLGSVFALLGLAGVRGHIFWIRAYNPTLGIFGIMPTIGMLGLSLLLILIGVFSFRPPR